MLGQGSIKQGSVRYSPSLPTTNLEGMRASIKHAVLCVHRGIRVLADVLVASKHSLVARQGNLQARWRVSA